jgi:hypothetical protein
MHFDIHDYKLTCHQHVITSCCLQDLEEAEDEGAEAAGALGLDDSPQRVYLGMYLGHSSLLLLVMLLMSS